MSEEQQVKVEGQSVAQRNLDAKTVICVDPPAALLDRPVRIVVSGLAGAGKVRIRSSFRDEDGVEWAGEGVFEAPVGGVLALDEAPAFSGTYEGADPMGLFWSMRPVVDGRIVTHADFQTLMVDAETPFLKLGRPNLQSLEPVDIELECFVDDVRMAEAFFKQAHMSTDVSVSSLLDQGIAAKVYSPASNPRAGVITITGSNGGYEAVHAPLLASHGFLAMSLAIFGAPGAPAHMHDLPIEMMARAFDWMADALGGRRVGVIGWSKGAESALVAASYLPDKVAAAVACVPCHYVMSGNDGDDNYDLPGWTLGGRALPYHLMTTPSDIEKLLKAADENPDIPIVLRTPFEEGYKTRLKDEALIPVERARCPLMFVSGGDDQNWPSTYSSAFLVDRLKRADYAEPVVHLDYPDAGHLISAANMNKSASDAIVHLVNKRFILCGGTPAANAKASRESWRRIVDFFNDHLVR